jgi:hypothetical protein
MDEIIIRNVGFLLADVTMLYPTAVRTVNPTTRYLTCHCKEVNLVACLPEFYKHYIQFRF